MIWKTKFERFCHRYGGEIKQTADVVFECPIKKITNKNSSKLEAAAWDAMWKQTGWKSVIRLPLNGGWSSVMGGSKYEKVEVPYLNRKIERPSKGKPVIACGFTVKSEEPFCGRKHGYRATGFFKLVPVKKSKRNGIIDKILAEETDPDAKIGSGYRMVECLAKDATIVEGQGVAGTVVPISEIELEKLVNWDDLLIRQEQGKYADKVAKLTDDDQMMNGMTFDRKWRGRMAKRLGLV